jgi:thioredoxin
MKSIHLIIGISMLLFTATACKQTDKKEINHKIVKEMNTVHLTKTDFLSKVANYEANPTEWKYLGDRPALVDFYASWCGPCKMIAPILEELAEQYRDKIYIYKIDTEHEQELAALFNIRSIPTLLFIPMNGSPQITQGAMSKVQLDKAIHEVLLKD